MKQNDIQLVPVDNTIRISNRAMADMLQLQNNDMRKQLQYNRAKVVTSQNNLSSISINNNALARFQSIVNEINLSTQSREITNQRAEIDDTQINL